ncbi:hypothetical protein [Pseudoclavibacter helvolus]|uniref:hypothetical protein n=1 Tax=Pseudoclavibacter helvolus TaxID=255205 RepID=UPI003C71BD95
MRREMTVVALAMLAATLCGCAPSPERGPGSDLDLAARSTPLAHLSAEEHLEAEAAQPSPTHGPASDAEAIAVASATLAAYARSDLPQRRWLEGLRPHLTAAALTSLGSVDPAAIPMATASGPIVLQRDSSGYLAHAEAPAGGGAFQLLLVREASGPWLVSSISIAEDGGS